jgi:hypothetical protein
MQSASGQLLWSMQYMLQAETQRKGSCKKSESLPGLSEARTHERIFMRLLQAAEWEIETYSLDGCAVTRLPQER